MSKKNFKTVGADLFFSDAPEANAKDTQDTSSTRDAKDTQIKTDKSKKYYRLNLKLDSELKEYIQEAAWLERMTVTAYFNNLIRTDKENKKRR